MMLDERLVGVWVHEDNINSPGGAGGFAAFSTVRTMELSADGSAREWSESAGGGADWSSSSGRELNFEGEWRTDGDTLLAKIPGMDDFRPLAKFALVDGSLVTQSDMGRVIWRRG